MKLQIDIDGKKLRGRISIRMDELTQKREIVDISSVNMIIILDGKTDVKHLISKKTHKSNILRF